MGIHISMSLFQKPNMNEFIPGATEMASVYWPRILPMDESPTFFVRPDDPEEEEGYAIYRIYHRYLQQISQE